MSEAPPPATTSTTGADDNPADAGTRNEARRDEPLTLGDHLEELRTVLIRCLIALGIGIGLCFLVFGDRLFHVFVAPLEIESIVLGHPPRIPAATVDADGNPSHLLVTIDVLERFQVLLFVAILGGTLFAGPYVLWQIWSFVRVGLYPRERRVFYLLMPASGLLFAGGVAFGYFIMLPVVVDFMLNLGGETFDKVLRTELRLSNYLTYFMVMTLVLGLIFQIPVGMTIVARITDVNPARLRTMRRYVIVGALIVGMMLTPPDPVTQVMLAVPIILLFELGLTFADWAHRVRMREHEAIMAEPDPWQQMWDEQGAEEAEAAEAATQNGDTETTTGTAAVAAEPDVAASGSSRDAQPAAEPDTATARETQQDADGEEELSDDVEPVAGPVPRSQGFVTWQAPRPAEPEPEPEPEPAEDEEPAATESSRPATSPFARPTPDGTPAAADASAPLEEGDVLALIDQRLEHYIREELPGLLREWIAEEVQRQLDARNRPNG